MSGLNHGRRGKAVSYPAFDLVHTELSICELKQVPSAASHPEEKANYFYSATVHDVDHFDANDEHGNSKHWTVGWCEFSAEKQVINELRAQVTATYLFIYAGPEAPAEGHWADQDVTRTVISVGVWPRFRDLVAHMMAQGSTVFPPLPAKPDKIGHSKRQSAATDT